VGIARTRYSPVSGMPLQSVAADEPGRLEIDPALEPGLRDLDGFSRLFVVSMLNPRAFAASPTLQYCAPSAPPRCGEEPGRPLAARTTRASGGRRGSRPDGVLN
jgi:tRNA (Thr-GGU) A37 N-methylase